MILSESSIDRKVRNINDIFRNWLSSRIPQKSLDWLDCKYKEITEAYCDRTFFSAFSAVSRYMGKQDLNLSDRESVNYKLAKHWTVDQIGRTLLLLALPREDSKQYLQTLERLFNAADVRELVTLYQALPFLSYPEQLQKRAAEGVRSNMTAVFNAVALNNSYPAEYFDDLAWNQMVLKALFVGSSILQIQGLQERINPKLVRMLGDYVSERQSANRSVPQEVREILQSYG
jgi:hypothetical protein